MLSFAQKTEIKQNLSPSRELKQCNGYIIISKKYSAALVYLTQSYLWKIFFAYSLTVTLRFQALSILMCKYIRKLNFLNLFKTKCSLQVQLTDTPANETSTKGSAISWFCMVKERNYLIPL